LTPALAAEYHGGMFALRQAWEKVRPFFLRALALVAWYCVYNDIVTLSGSHALRNFSAIFDIAVHTACAFVVTYVVVVTRKGARTRFEIPSFEAAPPVVSRKPRHRRRF
jgi:hypothetical protein